MCKGSFEHHGHRYWHGHRGHSHGRHFRTSSWQPLVNVREGDDRYELDLYAPELTREDFHLQLVDRVLTISAKSPQEEELVTPWQWIRREYRPGGFERSFQLSEKIDVDNLSASYADGVLHVILPKYPGQVTRRRDLEIV